MLLYTQRVIMNFQWTIWQTYVAVFIQIWCFHKITANFAMFYVTLAQHVFVNFWIFYQVLWNILLWFVEPLWFDENSVKKDF